MADVAIPPEFEAFAREQVAAGRYASEAEVVSDALKQYLADREALEDEGQHEHAGAGDRPRDQRAQDPGGHTEPGGQREHACPHHAADDHCGERRQGHLLYGTGLFGARRRLPGRGHVISLAVSDGSILSMRNPV